MTFEDKYKSNLEICVGKKYGFLKRNDKLYRKKSIDYLLKTYFLFYSVYFILVLFSNSVEFSFVILYNL